MNKIDFITLSRSDYASLEPIFRHIKETTNINARLYAGGSHHLKRYGYSIESIRHEFSSSLIELDFLSEQTDTPIELLYDSSVQIRKFAKELKKSSPDAIFIVGDRWEMLPIAYCAFMLQIPIIHHSGGDITQGSLDNQARYALSNFSHIHLVSLSEHKKRLLMCGEQDWRIEIVGEPALLRAEAIAKRNRAITSRAHKKKYALATFHPCSLDSIPILAQVGFFIECLDQLEMPVIITAPNPDAHSKTVYKKILDYSKQRPDIEFIPNLGAEYYQYLCDAELLIGNSSSGIWEASTFQVPVINIGSRQEGRSRSENVIDIGYNIDEFKNSCKKIQSIDFKLKLTSIKNIYYDNECLELINRKLTVNYDKSKLLNKKIFQ